MLALMIMICTWEAIDVAKAMVWMLFNEYYIISFELRYNLKIKMII